MSKSLKHMAYDTIEAHQETIADLRTQLAKANERVAELEKELKESDDDLYVTQQQSSNYESALEEIQAIFVDSDACPLFEPFNPKNLSAWLNKFAIEKKVEAIESFVLPYKQGVTKEYVKGGYGSLVLKAAQAEIEQLRKEQE